jgi:holliday junction DNA helicase RuvA
MIGRIRGTLVVKKAPWLIVELQSGLGFEIEAPMSTFYRLPELGSEIILYTHQVVREDAQLLYGFFDDNERSLFRALIKVNGVGPKLALTILSSLEPQAFVDCVNNNDSASLVRVPGIGKKTAERLVIEMRDRLADLFPSNEQSTASISGAPVMPVQTSPTQEAISALVALGYKPQEASRLVSPIDCNGLSCEAIIRRALQGVMA